MMFVQGYSTAPLFVIPKHWKQPNCPSSEDWLNKSWNILESNTNKQP